MPIREGAGWAWGARSRERAWGVRVGVGGYVGSEGWSSNNVEGDVGNGGGGFVRPALPGVQEGVDGEMQSV